MSAGRVVELVPQCAVCERFWWPLSEERWAAYLTDDEPPPELAFYCPDCAEREVGDD